MTPADGGHGGLARTGVAVLVAVAAVAAALIPMVPGAGLLATGGIIWVVLFTAAWVLPPPPTARTMRRLLSCLLIAVLVAAAGVLGLVGDWVR